LLVGPSIAGLSELSCRVAVRLVLFFAIGIGKST
jgi:hypothetical protein